MTFLHYSEVCGEVCVEHLVESDPAKGCHHLSSDNAAAGINPVPDNMFNTAFAINKDNVRYFKADVMPDIKTSLYNR